MSTYGEPWSITRDDGYIAIDDASGARACELSTGVTSLGQVFATEADHANARRIVACVNACQGLSDSALDAGVVGKVREALEHLCERFDTIGGEPFEHPADSPWAKARAALALLRESE